MSIHEKLMNIQSELKAPKGQFNNFGKYKYRSCEDVLESVKPLLKLHKATLTITDEIVNIGNRFYIKAIAKITDIENGENIEVSALAREDESKKGMDLSQVTGSTSSYARKYALNGLFCIDDTKDSDSTNTHGNDKKKENKPSTNNKALSDAQIKRLYAIAKSHNVTADDVKKVIATTYKKESANDLTKKEYDEIIARIEKKN